MQPREILAYAILVLIALFFASVALWMRHNSHHRTMRRNMLRDKEAYERRMAERSEQ